MAKIARAYNREKLSEAMNKSSIDAVVASSPWNVSYLSGMSIREDRINFTNPIFLITTSSGEQGIVINEADASFVRNDSTLSDIRSFAFGDTTAEATFDAIQKLTEMVSDFGLTKGAIGVETDYMPSKTFSVLAELLPDATLVDGAAALNEARIYKTTDEIEIMRRAAYFTDKAIHMGFASARPGDTERDVANAMQSFVLHYGATQLSHTVCSAGVQSTVVHAHPLDKPLQAGEVIHVDFGGMFDGYQTDLARNAVVGEPNPQQHDIYRNLSEIHQQLLELVKPGVVARDLFAQAQEVFAARGLVYPWGTLGHSTGLLVHEGFEITRTSERVIEAGMVLNIEPTHIEDGDARYHIEDTVLVTDTGVDVLSNYAPTSNMYVIR